MTEEWMSPCEMLFRVHTHWCRPSCHGLKSAKGLLKNTSFLAVQPLEYFIAPRRLPRKKLKVYDTSLPAAAACGNIARMFKWLQQHLKYRVQYFVKQRFEVILVVRTQISL